jgi:hypothetical protein
VEQVNEGPFLVGLGREPLREKDPSGRGVAEGCRVDCDVDGARVKRVLCDHSRTAIRLNSDKVRLSPFDAAR